MAVCKGGIGAFRHKLRRVARDVFLRPAVPDGFSVCSGRQIRNFRSPAVCFTEDRPGSFPDFASRFPGKGKCHVPGPDAVPVVFVRPDLLDYERYGFRRVGVGKDGFGSFRLLGGRVSFHGCFRKAVGNGLTVSVYRQVCKGMAPAVGFIQQYPAGFVFPACHSVQRDFHPLRPDPVLVVRIIPDLGDTAQRGFRHVGVGQHRDGAFHAGFLHVAFRCFLRPAVQDLLPVFMDRQVRYGGAPAVFFAENRRGRRLGFIAQMFHKGDRQALRPDAVLVIEIIPDLENAPEGGFRFVAVHQGGGVICCGRAGQGIAFRIRFLPGVEDLFPASVDRQARYGGGPAVFLRQGHRAGRVFAVKELNLKGFRPHTVPVVHIVPELPDGKVRRLRHMGIGDRGFCAFRGVCGCVARRHRLCEAPGDDTAVFVHRHLRLSLPEIFRRQGQGLQGPAVPVEGHFHLFRPQAVLVVTVLPDFPYGQGFRLRHMDVGKHRGAVFFRGLPRGVARRAFFRKGPGDLPALPVHGQVLERFLPFLLCGQGQGLFLFPVLKQGNGEFIRPDAVLVVPVLPDLLQGKNRGLRHMGVGDPDHGAFRFRPAAVARHFMFAEGVANPLSRPVHRQIF